MMLRDDNRRRIIWRTCDKELVVIKDRKKDIVYRQVRDKEEEGGGEESKGEKVLICKGADIIKGISNIVKKSGRIS